MHNHCVKSIRIRSYSGQYFPALGLHTERYEVSPRIQSECGKIRTRITPNTDTSHAVNLISYPYFLSIFPPRYSLKKKSKVYWKIPI